MRNIVLFCGGDSSEHEVSILSTKSILQASKSLKYNFSVLYISKNSKCVYVNEPRLPNNKELSHDLETLEKKLSEIKNNIDLAFLGGIHGGFAENGNLQHLLEKMNIRYSGSNSISSKLCMNKYKSTQIVESLVEGIFIPQSEIIEFGETGYKSKIKFPLIAKPNNDGSSNFVKVINTQEELDSYFSDFSKKFKNGEIILQEYIKNGIELTCGCLQPKNGEFIPLPAVEIIPKNNLLFDYKSKYADGGANEICPPVSIGAVFSEIITQKAIEIHKALGCRLYSRSDFIFKDNKLYYLETNTLPGMTKNSLIPKETKQVGIEFADLINFLIQNSL